MSNVLNGSTRRALVVLAALFGWRLDSSPADANPTGGTVAQGSAAFNSSGSHETITTSGNTYLNWQSFNIAAGETTTFVEPSATSVVWNNINGSSPSQILGNLNANGYVILQNQGGFYIGGQASISTHGLIMTTAPIAAPDLSSGGAWSFNTPPPTAQIINYGQINIAGGGSAYLIADNIDNEGTISAPSGKIGLYAGEQVLVSMSPDGRGLSAEVTLPEGSVDNNGQLIADGGSIAAQAQTVNQNGLVQANLVQNVNGTIELVASDAVNLGSGSTSVANGGNISVQAPTINQNGTIQANLVQSTSQNNAGSIQMNAATSLDLGSTSDLIANGGTISAQAPTITQDGTIQANSVQNIIGSVDLAASDAVALGANSAILVQGAGTGVSPGGNVTINAATTFSDQAGSTINISGAAQGGNGGLLNITAPQMASLNSTISGHAVAGSAGAGLSIDTDNILLNSDGTPVNGELVLNVNALSGGLSQINLQAANNIELSSTLNLTPESAVINTVSLLAGNAINVDQGAGITADGGRITLDAATVNQNGTLQANSVGPFNGVVEIDAGQSLNLGANSVISASGDSTATTASPGGFVVLQSGNTYADTPTSTINVTGQNGGQNGIVEIIGSGPVQSSVGANFALLENPYDLTVSSSPTSSSSQNSENDCNFNITDLSAYSQIDLHVLDDITLNTVWTLANNTSPSLLSLSAGNDITLNSTAGIAAGNDWGVTLNAGTAFVSTTAQPAPVSGSDGIYLDGGACLQTQNGDINVWAANEVQINSSASTAASDGIRTLGGGSIDVTTEYGDVNTGANSQGFLFNSHAAPYYTVSSTLGGISTADGGNVTINAGGDVTSYFPDSTTAADAGTGTFGSQPGDLTITAGGSVYGHYVVADGVGTINAGDNVGDISASGSFALSLIDGSWNVNAPNGNIYLQEVRNPNGIFNQAPVARGQSNPGENLFNYSPDASVSLNAIGVYLTSQSVPRLSDAPIPVLYAPILDITAGSGGVTLEGDVTLFPSVDQNLTINITDGGSLVGIPNSALNPELYMSDSSATRWTTLSSFTTSDNSTTLPVQVGDPNDPVDINVAGDMEDITLITSKETDITVGGNMDNCGFSGQNLSASDVTSITVGGEIYNQSAYTFINNVTIPTVPASDLLPGMGATWDAIFILALNSSVIATLTVPSTATTPAEKLAYALQVASLFGVTYSATSGQWVGNGGDQGFIYNTATGQLGYSGPMASSVLSGLSGPITVLKLVNGEPVIDASGHFETTTINWIDPTTVAALSASSQQDPSPQDAGLGYRIGGPGEFDVTAGQISLGNSYGILSCGVADTSGGFDRYGNLASVTGDGGASLNVTVNDYGTATADGDLEMLTSTIATLGGGNVNVLAAGSMDLGTEDLFNSSRQVGFGVFTAAGGNVSVIADGDIDIDGSRIATYDGGNIFVESDTGNVDVGSGGDTITGVYLTYVNPATGLAGNYAEDVFGSGIVANTLVPGTVAEGYPPADVGIASVPGNITVETPEGNITANLGGITQIALDGNLAAGPTINLSAGSPGYVGNIDLGQSGVIGGTVNATASGSITGLIISRQNSDINAAQNANVSVISGGIADVSGGVSVSGVIIGVGGANVSGASVTASVLGENVSVNGGASQSTLAAATATSTSQSAAQQASSSDQQLANSTDEGDDTDDKKKKKPALLQHIKRVTVILPKSV